MTVQSRSGGRCEGSGIALAAVEVCPCVGNSYYKLIGIPRVRSDKVGKTIDSGLIHELTRIVVGVVNADDKETNINPGVKRLRETRDWLWIDALCESELARTLLERGRLLGFGFGFGIGPLPFKAHPQSLMTPIALFTVSVVDTFILAAGGVCDDE
jgi:hypothetical protein